ncbi:hypothetical protein FZEAL_7871 [Fusarium zealandicum]|uniref:Uncharacterized protein n=1 Tax=Fusarium zealandicum TaxID=1053134 RepID=A0A8H4UF08_9HYPO|nr:hypothetical protein FZEAL_7871 [Fusarium zealandicum]
MTQLTDKSNPATSVEHKIPSHLVPNITAFHETLKSIYPMNKEQSTFEWVRDKNFITVKAWRQEPKNLIRVLQGEGVVKEE